MTLIQIADHRPAPGKLQHVISPDGDPGFFLLNAIFNFANDGDPERWKLFIEAEQVFARSA